MLTVMCIGSAERLLTAELRRRAFDRSGDRSSRRVPNGVRGACRGCPARNMSSGETHGDARRVRADGGGHQRHIRTVAAVAVLRGDHDYKCGLRTFGSGTFIAAERKSTLQGIVPRGGAEYRRAQRREVKHHDCADAGPDLRHGKKSNIPLSIKPRISRIAASCSGIHLPPGGAQEDIPAKCRSAQPALPSAQNARALKRAQSDWRG
jgi:hypothetical protein